MEDTRAPEEIDGEGLFGLACARCHGDDGRGGRTGPDLVARAADMDTDAIVSVILDGSGYMNPIPVSLAEAEAIAEYVEEGVLRR